MCFESAADAELWSLPSRGAWIETECRLTEAENQVMSLPSRGAWIETGSYAPVMVISSRRSPHGERGLKRRGGGRLFGKASLPSRGAWIETACGRESQHRPRLVAPLTGSVD